jgi:hypothetical protein
MTNTSAIAPTPSQTEQWGIFELSLSGSAKGNPFLDVTLSATFSLQHRTITVDGFYDGAGVYRVRFMPDVQGEWHYVTHSNRAELNGKTGEFTCVAPSVGNHGPVRVANTYHFAYADDTPYKQMGTTCYAWTHQGDALEEQTLATLRDAPFNKLRMCIFPKNFPFNTNEPGRYPFPCLTRGQIKTVFEWPPKPPTGWEWDFSRFEPAFFQHIEQRIGQLRDLGIEADLILFHPYDCWGFGRMDAESDDRYLRYVCARLSAYRNVWWSMANEYDLMPWKAMADWDRFFRVVQQHDPYQHPRSIHNCFGFYDHSKPWVTHQSIQKSELALTRTWREQAKKPVVVDECCYEGNIWMGWGNITAQELVHRFWLGTAGGGYVGHGETYVHPQDILWWAKGGVLHGQSAPRLAFLRRILEDGPAAGLNPIDDVLFMFAIAGQPHQYYLTYFGVNQPSSMLFNVPEGEQYQAEIVDTWEMTTTRVAQPVVRGAMLSLPGKPYQAVILRRMT